MAIVPILQYPDARLRQLADPVPVCDKEIATIVNNMYDTMMDARGLGLAAPQIGVGLQIVVVDFAALSRNEYGKLCFINPTILSREGIQYDNYGCLSVPNYNGGANVERAATVVVAALNQDGEEFTMTLSGDLAICIQHELDHLVGKLYIDYLSPLKKALLTKAMAKRQRGKA